MKRTAYIILTKVPAPGFVKTRLTPIVTASTAAKIQQAMLQNLLKQSAQVRQHIDIF